MIAVKGVSMGEFGPHPEQFDIEPDFEELKRLAKKLVEFYPDYLQDYKAELDNALRAKANYPNITACLIRIHKLFQSQQELTQPQNVRFEVADLKQALKDMREFSGKKTRTKKTASSKQQKKK
jgi:hypothetical protein